MVINHKYKFIFIHIPRTGGTSTREVLRGYEGSVVYERPWRRDTRPRIGPHEVLTGYIEKLGLKNTDSYFKWARVRNPWDRLVSIYNRRRKSPAVLKSNWACGMEAVDNPFGDWVEMQRGHPKPWRQNVFNQRRYINESQELDFVARFENINEDFSFFCDKVGLPQTKLPHKGAFAHDNYKEYYNKKLIDKLLGFDNFREDLDYLNYDYQP